MRGHLSGVLAVAATFLVGLGLLAGTGWASARISVRPGPAPTLNTVPPTVLEQSGVVLGAPAPDPPWCPALDYLPGGRQGLVQGRCPPAASRAAATQTLTRMNHPPREMVLADCSLSRLRIAHRKCWAAVVTPNNKGGVPGLVIMSSQPPPAGNSAILVRSRSWATLDFIDAASNRFLAEIYVSWSGSNPLPPVTQTVPGTAVPIPTMTPAQALPKG